MSSARQYDRPSGCRSQGSPLNPGTAQAGTAISAGVSAHGVVSCPRDTGQPVAEQTKPQGATSGRRRAECWTDAILHDSDQRRQDYSSGPLGERDLLKQLGLGLHGEQQTVRPCAAIQETIQPRSSGLSTGQSPQSNLSR